MTCVYIPPTAKRDPFAVSALKTLVFSVSMLSVGAFISIWGV